MEFFVFLFSFSCSWVKSANEIAVATDASVQITFPQIDGVTVEGSICASWDGLRCRLGVLQPAESANVFVSLRIASGLRGQTVQVCVLASGTATDVLPVNNQACFTRLIIASAQVDVPVTLDAQLIGGGSFPVKLRLFNRGYSDLLDTRVSILFPEFFIILPMDLPAGCAIEVGPTLVCAFGTVRPEVTEDRIFLGQISGSAVPSTVQICPNVLTTTVITTTPACSTLTISDLRVRPTLTLAQSSIQAGGVDVSFLLEARIDGSQNSTDAPSVEVPFPSGLLLTDLPAGCHTQSGVLTCAFASGLTGTTLSYHGAFRATPTAAAEVRQLCANARSANPSALLESSCKEVTVLRDYDLNRDGNITPLEMLVIQALYGQCLSEQNVTREIRKRQEGCGLPISIR